MAKKKPYRFFLYVAARFFAALICFLPRSIAQKLAAWGGEAAFLVVSRQRNKTLKNLRTAFGGTKSSAEIEKIARGVFRNFAQTAVEVLQFPKLTRAKIAELVDLGSAVEVYRNLLAEGHGLISITAHLGNWELLAGTFGLMGFQGAVIARQIYYEPYNRWVVGLRSAIHVPTIYRDRASRDILKVLGQNQIIGMLPDQDIEGLKGIFVDFFGRLAYTPVAPVRLALQLGTPILPNFLVRLPDGRYKVVLGEAIRPDSGMDRGEAVFALTSRWMQSFEKVIRQYPEQWAWMHDRWKTKPEAKPEAVYRPGERKLC